MRKAEAYRIASTEYGDDAAFVANLIMNQHRNPTPKIRGLVELLQDGHSIRTGAFAIDRLVIDGKIYGWEILESPKLVAKWHRFAPTE